MSSKWVEIQIRIEKVYNILYVQLREDLDKNVNKCIPVDTCPHDVATLLKEYFRDLPEPLLCKGLYTTFLETQRKMDFLIVEKKKHFTDIF